MWLRTLEKAGDSKEDPITEEPREGSIKEEPKENTKEDP